MRPCVARGVVAAAIAFACLGTGAVLSATPLSLNRDGTLQIAGHSLRCGNVRTYLDPDLPNLGAAGPGVLVMNPGLLKREATTVSLFVFQHECGHHHVGSSELAADCWAVERGVRDGWLDRAGLRDVCRSFGGAPETSTHPSAARRCRNLDRCFAAATATVTARGPMATGKAATMSWSSVIPAPKLVEGPKLVRVGHLRGSK